MKLDDMDPEEEVPIRECAAHHGLTVSALSLAIRKGRLPGYKPTRHNQGNGRRGGRVRQGQEAGEKQDSQAGTKELMVRVPEELHRRIKSRCKERGVTMTAEVLALLEKHFPPE
jgi:hypothetical protein